MSDPTAAEEAAAADAMLDSQIADHMQEKEDERHGVYPDHLRGTDEEEDIERNETMTMTRNADGNRQRDSFKLTGAYGSIHIESQRIEGGSIDVHETDLITGAALHPSRVVHTWDEARTEVGRLCAAAIDERRV